MRQLILCQAHYPFFLLLVVERIVKVPGRRTAEASCKSFLPSRSSFPFSLVYFLLAFVCLLPIENIQWGKGWWVPVTFAYGKERLADDETKDTNRFIASLSTLQELHHLGFTILYLCPSFFHTNILGRAKRKNKSKTKENDGDERRKEKWNWKTTSAWLSFRCKIGQALVFLFISFHHTFVSPSAAIHISYKIQPPKVSFS